jgi:hypothetical protein
VLPNRAIPAHNKEDIQVLLSQATPVLPNRVIRVHNNQEVIQVLPNRAIPVLPNRDIPVLPSRVIPVLPSRVIPVLPNRAIPVLPNRDIQVQRRVVIQEATDEGSIMLGLKLKFPSRKFPFVRCPLTPMANRMPQNEPLGWDDPAGFSSFSPSISP